MRKKIMCLLLAASLSLSCAALAYAEVHKGSKDWLVEFDGSKMNSNFSSSEMAEEIYSIQPGDSIELAVAVRNSSGETTDWYMTNEVLATLEESQNVAGGGAYAYRLVYQAPDGTEDVLYDSEAIGGEGNKKAAGEGLHQATDSLEDFFFLGTLKSSEKGVVGLTVKLDGESQGNTYQDTLAKLQMNFAVEKNRQDSGGEVQPREVTITPTPIANTVRRVLQQDSQNIIARSVKTGDPTEILPWCAAALAAGIALLAVGIAMAKRRNNSGEGGNSE